MNTAKTLIAWFLVCIVCAGATVLAVEAIEKPLGLRPLVMNFGQPKDTH
jgi:hypothetical protein